MGKIDEFEDKIIKQGMTDADFEEYKKLLKRVRGNFNKRQHCYNTAIKFPPENAMQAVKLIEYGLNTFSDGWFSTYVSYVNMGKIYETAQRYHDAYDSYLKLLEVLSEINNGFKEKTYGELCWMRLHIDNFQYSKKLEELYCCYDKMDEFSKEHSDNKFKRAIMQVIIASYHKQNEIAKEAYNQVVSLQNKYIEEFGLTSELNLFLQKAKNVIPLEIEEISISVNKELMKQYREKLLVNDFHEPKTQDLSLEKWCFFKQGTELTAFIVNLKEIGEGIEVVFGWASTAFTLMKGCENSLIENGIWNEYINIREKVIILHDEKNTIANQRIKEMYDKYSTLEKDELLEIAKQKRKEFINKIGVRLKPLGFKKKGNAWNKFIDDEFYVMFDVQKSNFSDEYYFNVIVNTNNREFVGECFYGRVFPEELCPLDWQLFPGDKFMTFLDKEVVDLLVHIINTPLLELGKEKMIWEGCTCERDNCTVCWVEKNLWEIKKDEETV